VFTARADFTVNDSTQCFNTHSFEFLNTSLYTGGHPAMSWWLNGNYIDSATPSHFKLLQAGTWQLKLLMLTAQGCLDSAFKTLTVHPVQQSLFQLDDSIQCLSGNTFTATNLTKPNGSQNLYPQWLLDMQLLTSPDSIHVADTGTHTLLLTSVNEHNCRDTFSMNLYVRPSPIVGMSVNDAVQCLDGNLFSLTSYQQGADSLKWTSGSQVFYNAAPFIHFTLAGTYPVSLSGNSEHCVTTLDTVLIVLPDPVVSVTADQNTRCLRNNLFTFSIVADIDHGSLRTFESTFGDGDTAFSTTASKQAHSYDTTGIFLFTARVTSDSGCAAHDSVLVTVTQDPVLPLIHGDTVIEPGVPTSYYSDSLPGTVYNWMVEKAETVSQTGLGLKIKASHDSPVLLRLVATDLLTGCSSDTAVKNIRVRPVAEIPFVVYPNPAHLRFYLRFDAAEQSTYHASLYNNIGQLIHEFQFTGAAGSDEFILEPAPTAHGIFVLKLEGPDFSHTVKIVLY
jgi:hypothetical protein